MLGERPRLAEKSAVVGKPATHEPVQWHCQMQLRKFHGESTDPEDIYEVLEREGNVLTYGGASVLWECLIGNGTAVGGNPLTFFDNTNAHLGVGDGTTAATASDTALAGASIFLEPMDTGYPAHTDSASSGAESIQFRATFETSNANFAWEEWGLFNASASGRMLNRKVESLGTKTSSSTWEFTITLSLA